MLKYRVYTNLLESLWARACYHLYFGINLYNNGSENNDFTTAPDVYKEGPDTLQTPTLEYIHVESTESADVIGIRITFKWQNMHVQFILL